MATKIFRKIARNIQNVAIYTITTDETADVLDTQQIVFYKMGWRYNTYE